MASRESKWSGIGGAGGGGGVSGPGVSTDGALPEFNGTTGSLLRESTARIDADDLSLAGQAVKFNRDGVDIDAADSGLDVLGTGNVTLAQLLFDPLLSSRWKAGPAGSLSAVLTIAAVQAVQNKSLDNSNSADFKATSLRIEDPSDPTKKIRFDSGSVTPGQTRVITAIDENLTLLGESNVQDVFNKTIMDSIFDGGTATASRKIILPQGTKAALDALTQEEGAITFATDEDRAYVSNGTAQIKVGTVDGPASSTDNQFVRFDGVTGKMIQSSAVSANDSGDMDGVNDLNMAGDLTVGGNTVLTGNLQVNGTQTLLNTDQLQVEDQTIQVNFGGTDASAEGGGIEVVGTANAARARIQYDSSLTSKFKAGAAGSEKEVATVSDSQTVSNKTLNNTNSAALKDTSFTLEDPADATKKVRFDAGAVTAGQTRVMGVPDADTTLVGTNTTQTVTNKLMQDSIIDGGTASASRRINLPKDTYANLLALARSEGAAYYATDLDQIFTDDGTQLKAAGSGGSEGGVNLLTNPYDGWVASGVGVTVAVTTTASELPLAGVDSSGIKISFVSGTDYVRRRFQTTDAMLSTVLGISFWQKTLNSYASNDAKLELWVNSDTTAGSYTGSYTEVSLVSDVSGETYIPASNAKLPLSAPYNFLSDATLKNYELRIVRVQGTGSIVIQRPSVGTPAMQQGAAINQWQSYPATGSWVSNASYTGLYRRVGSQMEAIVKVTVSGGAPTSATLTINLPSGLTIDTTKLPTTTGTVPWIGHGFAADAGVATYGVAVVYNNTTSVVFQTIDDATNTVRIDASVNATNPIAFNNGDYVEGRFSVPIAEWSSGTVNSISQNTQSPIKAGIIMPFAGSTVPTGWLECDGSSYAQSLYPQLYAVLGSTWATCTNPLTGSAYSAPSAGNFRVPDLRGSFLRGAGTFTDGIGTDTTLAGYQADQMQGHKHNLVLGYGAVSGDRPAVTTNGASSTNDSVSGGAGSIVTDGTNGTPRTGKETRPRNIGVKYIIKAWDESFNLAGFAEATSTQMGLVQGGRLPGASGAAAIEPGKIGETIQVSLGGTAAGTSNVVYSIGSYTPTSGVWMVHAFFYFTITGITANTYVIGDLNTSTSLRAPGFYGQVGTQSGTVAVGLGCQPYAMNANGSTSIHALSQYDFSAKGSSNVIAKLTLVRIG